jgi:hypothetical protein
MKEIEKFRAAKDIHMNHGHLPKGVRDAKIADGLRHDMLGPMEGEQRFHGEEIPQNNYGPGAP